MNDSPELHRAVLVGAGEEREIPELGRLASTLGLEVVGALEQNRCDPRGYLGRGKRREARELAVRTGADVVVTDDELTASQARVLEKDTGVPVIDRTALIIKIFGEHARDAASRLEVELAELEYRLPRVKGSSTALSRLGGGMGGARRGPGEQQLEYDRRLIRERIERINLRLESEKAARRVRSSRLRGGLTPKVVLVGYTNAGKTTILNALSGADRSTRDRLFETLETTTRLVEGGSANGHGTSHPDFVITDTVGFIRKLPAQLVHSFASTLEATKDADLLVLCADASSDSLEEEIQTVRHTLSDALGEDKVQNNIILCLNKMDIVPRERKVTLRSRYQDAVMISAVRSCEALKERIYGEIESRNERIEVLIPHSEYGLVSELYGMAEIHAQRELYGMAEIHAQRDMENGVWMDVSVPHALASRYSHYRVA